MNDSDSGVSYNSCTHLDDPPLDETQNSINQNFEERLRVLEQNSEELKVVKEKLHKLQELQNSDKNRIETKKNKLEHNDDERLRVLEKKSNDLKEVENKIHDLQDLEEFQDASTRFLGIETRLNKLEEDDDDFYPSDTYSFLSLCGPIENPPCFFFGLFVFLFQIAFLLFMLLDTVKESWSSIETDNDKNSFIPGDVETLVKLAQVLSILAYTLFPADTMSDLTNTLRMMPDDYTRANIFKIMACLFRLIQGGLATGATFLLVITSTTVKDVVLNFAAVNFISSLDDVAFTAAAKAYYGPTLKKETKKVMEETRPRHNRFTWAKGFLMFLIPVLLLLCYGFNILWPQLVGANLTSTLRVDFEDSSLAYFKEYNGCYKITKTGKSLNSNRVMYKHSNPSFDSKFAYCKGERKWLFYIGSTDNACEAHRDINVQSLYSAKSKSFDIFDTFGSNWFLPGGYPFDFINFLVKSTDWTDNECDVFPGNGVCEPVLNTKESNWDGGDCCSNTCDGLACGQIKMAFNTTLNGTGKGYPQCKGTAMIKYSIILKDFQPGGLFNLTCDDKEVLRLNLHHSMKNKMEYVYLPQNTECKVNTPYIIGGYYMNITFDPQINILEVHTQRRNSLQNTTRVRTNR